jgi:hypothetical protein
LIAADIDIICGIKIALFLGGGVIFFEIMIRY